MKATLLCLSLIVVLTGCSDVYYNAWETLGVHKRDIMVDRVEETRDDQEEAKEQFASALERFTAMFEFEGGELQDKYDILKAELDASEAKAKAVTDRINSVQDVSEALFAEWEAELEQYTNDDLRATSEDQMDQTRRRYDQMIKAMRKAESRMQPVLDTFRDQVLFIKHNLNARAIASIEDTAGELETDVAGLIEELEASIEEADAFIDSMGTE